ncbi:MAG: hypothetical protein JST47_14995 [Bacteroidetes bacterium]|nr:hypothetical protein [Bacteroidota bacterium]MBS1975439.1 hypothetical protein [Bacteroidota bacterium]
MYSFKFLLVFALGSFFFAPLRAQYKRRGEILQSRLNKKSAPKKTADFRLEQLLGKWQELERKKRIDSSAVSYNDSIQLKFSDSNKVMTRTSTLTSMAMVGEAQIDEDNVLTAAADEYTIKSVTTNYLVLDDNDQYLHYLKKVNNFWYETLGKSPVKQDIYDTPISVTINAILGKWFVYRRRAKPGAINDNVLLIKHLDIPDKLNEHTATGNVVFYNGQHTRQSACTVSLEGSKIKIAAGKNSWDFSVYQADTENFVFGNSTLLYFSKPAMGN